jgi:hypothetical protein
MDRSGRQVNVGVIVRRRNTVALFVTSLAEPPHPLIVATHVLIVSIPPTEHGQSRRQPDPLQRHAATILLHRCRQHQIPYPAKTQWDRPHEIKATLGDKPRGVVDNKQKAPQHHLVGASPLHAAKRS